MTYDTFSLNVSSYTTLRILGAVGLSAMLTIFPDLEMCREVPVQETRYHYTPVNAGASIGIPSSSFTGDSVTNNYIPRTSLGERLLALRRAYVLSGGVLVEGEELDKEMRRRRGGIADA